MPLKAVISITLISLSNNISMAGISKVDLQIVTIGQLKEVIKQINTNQEAFNNKLKNIETKKVKLLAVKQFNGCYGPSYTSAPVTKARLTGTGRHDGTG